MVGEQSIPCWCKTQESDETKEGCDSSFKNQGLGLEDNQGLGFEDLFTTHCYGMAKI